MPTSPEQAEFVQLIAAGQRRLYAYILSMLPSPQHADDVLQETNVVLWEKMDTFEPGTNFNAWSFKIAYFQTKAYLKKHRRQSGVIFDAPMIERLASLAASHSDELEERHQTLRGCLAKLGDEDRDLIRRRYQDQRPVNEIAAALGRTAGALRQALYRIRGNLRRCIEQQNPGAA